MENDFHADVFALLLDARLRRRNARLWGHLLAWAEILDSLGWCVALKDSAGSPILSANAAQALAIGGSHPVAWTDIERHLQDRPPAIRRVNHHELQVWAPVPPPTSGPRTPVPLTKREAEILHWLREGKTGPEIALILGRANRTVESHVARLYRKLGFRNRADVFLGGAPFS